MYIKEYNKDSNLLYVEITTQKNNNQYIYFRFRMGLNLLIYSIYRYSYCVYLLISLYSIHIFMYSNTSLYTKFKIPNIFSILLTYSFNLYI